MTFDQFANQGGASAWDTEEAAATRKAAEEIFSASEKSAETPDEGTDRDNPAPDPSQPGEVEDPDLTLEP